MQNVVNRSSLYNKKKNFVKINFKYLKIAIKDDRCNLFARSNLFAPTVVSFAYVLIIGVRKYEEEEDKKRGNVQKRKKSQCGQREKITVTKPTEEYILT